MPPKEYREKCKDMIIGGLIGWGIVIVLIIISIATGFIQFPT